MPAPGSGGAYVDDDGFEDLDDLFQEDIEAHAVPNAFEVEADEKVSDALDDVDCNGDGNEEPPWLCLDAIDEDYSAVSAADADAKAEYIEGLPENSDRPVADLEEVCTHLAQYLIGHPSALITKMRRFPKKGSKSRYFGEERSEDVMADKVVTGCWACGKLTHDSNDCEFKRCFNCSEQGHQYSECHRSKKVTCFTCRIPGHDQDDCPLVEYNAGIFKREDGDLAEGQDGIEYTDLFFCRCLKCGEDGHVTCAPIPVSNIVAPEVKVAAVPPGYDGAVNGGRDPWVTPPPRPAQMLRPRAAMAAIGGPRPPAQPPGQNGPFPPGPLQPLGAGPRPPVQPPPGKGRPRPPAEPPLKGLLTPSIMPARPSAAPTANQYNSSGLRNSGSIAPLKRARPDSDEDWSALWEDEPKMMRSVAKAVAAKPSGFIGGKSGHQHALRPQRSNGSNWTENQAASGGWQNNRGWSNSRTGGGPERWGGSGGQQGGWQKSSW